MQVVCNMPTAKQPNGGKFAGGGPADQQPELAETKASGRMTAQRKASLWPNRTQVGFRRPAINTSKKAFFTAAMNVQCTLESKLKISLSRECWQPRIAQITVLPPRDMHGGEQLLICTPSDASGWTLRCARIQLRCYKAPASGGSTAADLSRCASLTALLKVGSSRIGL